MKTVAFFMSSPKFRGRWALDEEAAPLSGTDSSMVFLIRALRESGRFETLLLGCDPPEGADVRCAPTATLADALRVAQSRGAQHLVANVGHLAEIRSLKDVPPGPTQIVVWAHNSPSFDWLCEAHGLRHRFRLVAVSDSQRYGMVVHPIYPRTLSIPNPAPEASTWEAPGTPGRASARKICYVGALKPSKGFHHLARIWPEFRAAHPDVELVVCGSSSLYDPGAQCGIGGLSETAYEEEILGHLGGSLESARRLGVRFMGSLPKAELRDEIRDSLFAVVNPNLKGSTETFCCSAVEALSLGIPVVAAKAGALKETVGHNVGGLLFADERQFLAFMGKLVSDEPLRRALAERGFRHVTQSYGRDRIERRWIAFLEGEKLSPFAGDVGQWMTFGDRAKALQRLLPMRLAQCLRHTKARLRAAARGAA